MSVNQPAWLEVAVNGPWSRQRQPGIPVTADEIDRILGTLYAAVEATFPALLGLAFASHLSS